MKNSLESFLQTIASSCDRDLKNVVGGQALGQMELKEPEWMLSNYLPVGLALVVGKPKTGKSWLALQIAAKVAGGGMVLGAEARKSQVLYLGFEDSLRRVRRRLQALVGSVPAGFSLMSMSELGKIKNKIAFLDKYLSVNRGCKFAVIDTLKRFLPPSPKGLNIYDAEVVAMSELHELADRHSACILCVHHCRKSRADDIFDSISGSQALMGTADTIWVFGDIKFGSRELHITGRDVEQQVLAIRQEGCRWELVGDAAKVQRSARRLQVLKVFQDNPGRALGLAEIRSELLGLSEGVVKNTLSLLVKEGLLSREGRNSYKESIKEELL